MNIIDKDIKKYLPLMLLNILNQINPKLTNNLLNGLMFLKTDFPNINSFLNTKKL